MGIFDQIFGGTSQPASGGMSPITMALMGLLAYRTMQGKGRLADVLGTHASAQPGVGAPSGGTGLGGLLGGLLGGGAATGGLLSNGLNDLLKHFEQNGQGDKMRSWIQPGPNKPIAPDELENALGPDRLSWLMQQTGMSRDALLSGLSQALPNAVDKLTPDGRIPTQQEAASLAEDAAASHLSREDRS
jgi:uncharacterized protein YidB (DUF937 family)